MRLRVCLMLSSVMGAVGSLILAADLQRRLSSIESSVLGNAAHSSGPANLVFTMAHVLGAAGIGIIFLAICLMLIAEKRSATTATADSTERELSAADRLQSVVSIPLSDYARVNASDDETSSATTVETVADKPLHGAAAHAESPRPAATGTRALPIPPTPPPKNPPPPTLPHTPSVPFRPARNIYIVQAPAAPNPNASLDVGAEPIGVPMQITETEFRRAVVYEKVLQEQGEVPIATPIESETTADDAAVADESNTHAKPNGK